MGPCQPARLTSLFEIDKVLIKTERERFSYQRSRAPDNPALVVVLRAMARANELVFSSIPGHNTP